jgi:hypothetical protein
MKKLREAYGWICGSLWASLAVLYLVFGVNRSLADAPPGRYAVAADTVNDTRTGLTWQRKVAFDGSYTLEEARAYCSGLVLGGFSDWRLPSKLELESLVDDTRGDPAIDTLAFPGTPAALFWTSTTSADSVESAWYVAFGSGYSLTADVSMLLHARCVR